MQKTRNTQGVVRRNITKALFELMAEKPLDDITITELVERAQVARISFYRNFDSKDDVLRQDARRVTQSWLDSIGGEAGLDDPHFFIEELLNHIYAHREEMYLYMRSQRLDIVHEEFNNALGVGCADKSESAKRAFLAGGLCNLCIRWAMVDFEPSPEAVANFVSDLISRRERPETAGHDIHPSK